MTRQTAVILALNRGPGIAIVLFDDVMVLSDDVLRNDTLQRPERSR
jgi:hypothetical protein